MAPGLHFMSKWPRGIYRVLSTYYALVFLLPAQQETGPLVCLFLSFEGLSYTTLCSFYSIYSVRTVSCSGWIDRTPVHCAEQLFPITTLSGEMGQPLLGRNCSSPCFSFYIKCFVLNSCLLCHPYHH